VLVVGEPSKLWLADGYHRLFVHRAVGAVEIEAEVRRGTREDALRLSLAANATHGKQRTVGDFKRRYGIAVRNTLVDADDSVGLMELLRCSIRTAEEMTREARKQVIRRAATPRLSRPRMTARAIGKSRLSSMCRRSPSPTCWLSKKRRLRKPDRALRHHPTRAPS
jgi:hypothetical protein